MKNIPNLLPAFLLLTLCFLPSAFALEVGTYDQLLKAIRETQHDSQARIEQAVNQENIREAWETGKLIDQHILLHKGRAEYGAEVIQRLAEDLGTSKRELHYRVEFARAYPIVPTSAQLSWGHYRDLLSINNAESRNEIAKTAEDQKWPLEELRRQIKKRKLPVFRQSETELQEVSPGKIGVYRIVEINHEFRIDVGFSIYRELSGTDVKKYKKGDAVRCRMPDAGSVEKQKSEFASCVLNPESSLSDFYSYPAQVTEVYDGDTFHALIDLGFGTLLNQRLRLRQLDAPELISTEGKDAKAALEKILMRDKGKILLKTSKSDDQYGRYLADVWVKDKNINPELLETELFIVRGDESRGPFQIDP